jgi:hypothetical protein
MVIYHYMYQAFIRLQIGLGGVRNRYVEWKASMGLIMIDILWVMIAASWIKIHFKYDLFFGPSLAPALIAVGFIVLLDKIGLSSKEVRADFERRFIAWPKGTRNCLDFAVGAFVLLTLAITIYSMKKVSSLS